ncbi:MAG: MltA domain-containing protein, partial [Beijerinckiaceae bacterium]
MQHFKPFRIQSDSESAHGQGFLTGYYEPVVEGRLTPSASFSAPILSRPTNLVTFANASDDLGLGLSAGIITRSGALAACPDRAAIENGALEQFSAPLVWLRDHAEVFLIQVQGSAQVRLPGGRTMRLGYAGRNGHPYSSIGRMLIEMGEIAQSEMSLARLKQWIRQHGQRMGDAGRALMQRNKSYVFFKIDESLDSEAGPVGAAGLPLTPLRSIAVDRSLWHYGLPFWISAELPWASEALEKFERLM